MNKNEREELAYDIANHYASRTTKAGLYAMAIDRMMDMLLLKDDEELIAMAPDELVIVPSKTKERRNRAKPKGF